MTETDLFPSDCTQQTMAKSFWLIDDMHPTPGSADRHAGFTHSEVSDKRSRSKIEVLNPDAKLVLVTGIDKCVPFIRPGTADVESTCDIVLRYGQAIMFVELKAKATGGIEEGLSQIRSTINLYGGRVGLNSYAEKRAFVKVTHESINERAKALYRETGFKLTITAPVRI